MTLEVLARGDSLLTRSRWRFTDANCRLNALANRGYLPYNGFANILDITAACAKVYGLSQVRNLQGGVVHLTLGTSQDFGLILAAYGGAIDGIGLGWSM
jgi:hypothetical protein